MDLETQPPLLSTTEVSSKAQKDVTSATPTTFSRFRQKRRSFGSSPLEKKTSTTDDDALPILGRMADDAEDLMETEADNNDNGSGVFLLQNSSDVDSVASSPFKMKNTTAAQAEEEPLPLLVATTTASSDEDDDEDDDKSVSGTATDAGKEEDEDQEPSDSTTTSPSPKHKVPTMHNSSPTKSLVDSDEEEEKEWNLESDNDEKNEPVSNDNREGMEHDESEDDTEPERNAFQPGKYDNDDEEEAMETDEPVAPEKSPTNDEPSSNKISPTKETAAPLSHDTPKKLPDRQSLITSTDQLFLQVSDKEKVTVKDILQSLQIEYECPKFDKESKVIVRERLTALILGKVQPLEESDHEDEASSSSSEEEEVSESEASGVEADGDDDSEYESRRKKVGRKKKTPQKKTSQKAATSSDRKSRVKRKSAAAIKAAAVRVQAEQLRKKRLEELRVRNEELQLIQNQEEQKRAARIAAKLETDTEEVRMARLEQRLDLLQKLDQKRFTVIQDSSTVKVEEEKKHESVEEKSIEEESDEEEESSDDEMELELVGNKPTKPFVSLKPDALSLLSWADQGIRAPATKKDTAKATSKAAASDATTDEFLSLLNQTKQTRASPGQSMNARAFLKKRLLSRQRRMGNQWLARELGYQNEREHMDDCLEVENQKRLLTLKKEQERIEANERKMLRERWIKAEDEPQKFDDDEDPDDEDYKDPNEEDKNDQIQVEGDEEEDEEMAMARELGAVESTEANRIESEVALLATTETSDPAQQDDDAPAPLVETIVEVSRDSVNNIPPGDEETTVSLPTRMVSADNAQEDGVGETDESTDTLPSVKVSVNTETETSVTTDTLELETQPPIATGNDDGTPEFEAQPPVVESATTEENEEIKEPEADKPKGPRNSAWREMLRREAEKVKKLKKRNGEMIDDEADEEEEEEIVGLEDFGFAMHKKKKTGDDDEENEEDDELDQDDLENVVDDVSDGEGDEDAGEEARKALQLREEKERHREIMRRMREGYDGRRGGIAGGGAGARGLHRFDQLVAADNREDAKRLGLLNDDEMDSDDEKDPAADDDEEEDEAAQLDQMLKDRFLHRSSVEMEENFSEDEGQDEDNAGTASGEKDEDLEEKEQERMAKRFTKRARMQRLIEAHGHEEEFSQMKLMEEDTTLKEELQKIKVILSLMDFA
eukprot:scaffold1353_cov161-Amphora_coffeaeformis.AAC.38